MSVYVANIFATLLTHARKFREVKIWQKVSPILVSNGRQKKRPEIKEFRKLWEIRLLTQLVT